MMFPPDPTVYKMDEIEDWMPEVLGVDPVEDERLFLFIASQAYSYREENRRRCAFERQLMALGVEPDPTYREAEMREKVDRILAAG